MQTIPDWAAMWRDIVQLNDRWQEPRENQEAHWEKRARTFADDILRRWMARPDSSRDFLISTLKAHPGSTLVDIGAGTGAWAALAAGHATAVTAVDSSPAMIAVMRENLDRLGVSNVRIVNGTWPEVDLEPHDFSFCSHAMYGVLDLPGFIRKMVAVTRRTCMLLIRAPRIDGLMAEFARTVLGHPHDSANFVIAYNALIEMGIYANVMVEDTGWWNGWTNDSLEAALADTKRRLGLKNNPAYDDYLLRRLQEELTYTDGKYVWPQGIRSVLVYWDVQVQRT